MKILVSCLVAFLLIPVALAQTGPAIVTAPWSIVEIAGNTVLLAVTASGTAPLNYQWTFNGNPLTGATASTLVLPAITSAQAGNYAVKISNSLGSVSTSAAKLTVLASNNTNGIDPTFVPTPAPEKPPSIIVEQPDEKLLVVANFTYFTGSFPQKSIARLGRDGTIDLSFKPSSDLNADTVTSLVLQSDGRILVSGSFASIGGIARPGLARLNSDGSLDATFAPSATVFTGLPSILGIQADGKIVVSTSAGFFRVRLDGSVDSSVPLVLPGDRFALSADGKIIAASLIRNPLVPPTAQSGTFIRVSRYGLDGTPDSSFAASDLSVDPTSVLQSISLIGLRVLTDGRITVVYNFDADIQSGRGWFAARLNSDGSRDSTYSVVVPKRDFLHNSPPPVVAISASGEIDAARAEPRANLSYAERYSSSGARSYASSFFVPIGSTAQPFSAVCTLASRQLIVASSFSDALSNSTSRMDRLTPFVPNPPVVVAVPSGTLSVNAGDSVPLKLVIAGSGPFTYRVNGGTAYSSYAIDLSLSDAQQSASYSVTLTNDAGAVTLPTFNVNVTPTAPVFTAQPQDISAISAYTPTATFTAAVRGSEPFTYQWFLNGTSIAGATSATLTVPTTAASTGRYTLAATNSAGQTLSREARLTVEAGARIVNLASRGMAGTGENVLIAGFTITGSASKSILIRAAGPALAKFALTGVLADPQLTVYNSAGAIVGQNDDWTTALPDGVATFDRVGAFRFDAGSRDSALLLTLAPGGYTAVISNRNGATGVALAEVYEADSSTPRLVNLSSRLLVGTGEQIAIPGIVIRGASPKKILIRGIGPALAGFGVQNPLADPVLTVIGADNATLATNDNWSSAANAAEIAATATTVGAFPLATGSKDAAVLLTLPPGSYTALVSGVANTSGVALVEVYEVP